MPEIRTYVAIYHNIFTAAHWERFGLSWFESAGWRVVALDCTALFSGRTAEELSHDDCRTDPRAVVVDSHEALAGHLDALTPGRDLVGVFANYDARTLPMFQAIATRRLPYLLTQLSVAPVGLYPVARAGRSWAEWLAGSAYNLRFAVRRLATLIRRAVVGSWAGVSRPFAWAYAGWMAKWVVEPVPALLARHRISTVSLEVRKAEGARDAVLPPELTNRAYAVLIDEQLLDHPDFLFAGVEPPVTPEAFGPALDAFLVRVEAEIGLPVVVAGNPKAPRDGRAALFGGRPVLFDMTEALIRDAALVIGHFSTAMAYAVVADLPVMVLTTDEFERSGEIEYVKRAAAALGVARLNIDHLPNAALALPRVDERAYDRYRSAYLGDTGATADGRPVWERIVTLLDADRGGA